MPEDSGLLFQNHNFTQVNELIQENKVRIKLLLQEQKERILVARLESVINKQVSISQFASIKPDLDNSTFLRSQTDEDRELILLTADQQFVDSLSLEDQQQAKQIRRAQANAEKASKEKVDKKADEEFGESEEEDNDSEGEEEEKVIKEDEGYCKREDDEDEDRDYQDSELEEEDEKMKLEDDRDEDEELIFKETVVNDNKRDNNQKQIEILDIEQLTENCEEKDKEKEVQNDGVRDEMMMDIESEKQETNKAEAIKDGEVIDEEEEIIISESIQKSGFIFEEEELEYAMDDNDNYYDCIVKIFSKLDDLNKNTLMYREAQDAIIKHRILETVKKPQYKVEQNNNHFHELIKNIFTMFVKCKQPVNLNTPGPLYKVESFFLLCKYLICLSLNPHYERVILPVLSLYLIDYTDSVSQEESNKQDVKAKIVSFFCQYAIRSPYIFFMPFNTSSLRLYLGNKENNLDLLENFSLLGILFNFFISHSKQQEQDQDAKTKEALGQLIMFLLELRLNKSENANIPESIKILTDRDDLPIPLTLVQSLGDLIEECPRMFEKGGPSFYYSWLKSLTCMNQYRKNHPNLL